MKNATLLFLVKEGKILLGMKKRGFGAGKWNGYGGKVGYGEDIKEAAVREIWEECHVRIKGIKKFGELTFLFPLKPEWNQIVHVFISREWDGTPTETDEMKPGWFDIKELPFYAMWKDDPHWLPKVLAGDKIKAKFIFGADNESIELMKIGSLPKLNGR